MAHASFMPIYQYISEEPEDPARSCRMCSKVFELMRPVDRAALTHCLYCKNPVRKVIGSVNVPKILAPLSVSDAKKSGFTIMEKRDTGVYEKL